MLALACRSNKSEVSLTLHTQPRIYRKHPTIRRRHYTRPIPQHKPLATPHTPPSLHRQTIHLDTYPTGIQIIPCIALQASSGKGHAVAIWWVLEAAVVDEGAAGDAACAGAVLTVILTVYDGGNAVRVVD